MIMRSLSVASDSWARQSLHIVFVHCLIGCKLVVDSNWLQLLVNKSKGLSDI